VIPVGAGLLGGSTKILQLALIAAIGQNPNAALVLTAVILAAAFTPIKNLLQSMEDKRFREPADPISSLRGFQCQLHAVAAVIDVERVLGRLLDEAIRPLVCSGAGIYLMKDGESLLVKATPRWDPAQGALLVPMRGRGKGLGILQHAPAQPGRPYPKHLIEFLRRAVDEVGSLVATLQRLK